MKCDVVSCGRYERDMTQDSVEAFFRIVRQHDVARLSTLSPFQLWPENALYEILVSVELMRETTPLLAGLCEQLAARMEQWHSLAEQSPHGGTALPLAFMAAQPSSCVYVLLLSAPPLVREWAEALTVPAVPSGSEAEAEAEGPFAPPLPIT